MNVFTERVIKIIRCIPAGKVMTYGQVAAAAGNQRGARQVSRILHSMSKKYDLPWHRIINAQGGISTPVNADQKGIDQRKMLEMEGVKFGLKGKVDLSMYRWFPKEKEL